MDMDLKRWLISVLFLLSSVSAAANVEQTKSIDLRMPDVQPTVMDSYFCYPMKVDSDYYITGIHPHARMEIAHHVVLYGCKIPGRTSGVWDCGEVHTHDQQLELAEQCHGDTIIMYAWGRNATELRLPEGVGYKVGADTRIQWIVLQVHYNNVSIFQAPYNERDRSGVTIVTTNVKQPRRASFYILATAGKIPPHSTTYMESACEYKDTMELHAFAFRTHTHGKGRVVSGYRVRDGIWTEIGQKDPRLPQLFYNITTPDLIIKPGDLLASRCTMVNDGHEAIKIGATDKDEMCNFYILFYVDGDRIPDEIYCYQAGPQHWSWELEPRLHPENVPLNVSIIPGTNTSLKATPMLLEPNPGTIKRKIIYSKF